MWLSLLALLATVAMILVARAFLREASAREQHRRDLAANGALLRDALVEMRDLYEHAPCGYHSVDGDGIVVRMNDTELGWLGYAREEVLGRMHISELVMPAQREATRLRLADFR